MKQNFLRYKLHFASKFIVQYTVISKLWQNKTKTHQIIKKVKPQTSMHHKVVKNLNFFSKLSCQQLTKNFSTIIMFNPKGCYVKVAQRKYYFSAYKYIIRTLVLIFLHGFHEFSLATSLLQHQEPLWGSRWQSWPWEGQHISL